MKRFAPLILVLVAACSCNMADNLFHSMRNNRVAVVGKNVLYRSELEKVIPEGVSPEDSVMMAERYINSWALGKLLLDEADARLSKEQKSVDEQVAEFRQNLLTFRYEKLCVAERLDTVVTREEAQEYYDSHKQEFVSPCSVIRGRVVRISKKSPFYPLIRDNYKSTSEADVSVLKQTAFSSAEEFTDFGGVWVPVSALARAMGQSEAACEADLAKATAFEKDIDGRHYLVFIQERTAPGAVSPLEYNLDKIGDILISRRKQEILSSLEQELLKDALENGKLKKYDNQDD
ncbi:MAG: peptidyl-prolyl cis-trans isomerase [Bacteroidales bacterium]|nr:peptidyl-prolyl cis-trans isomerase [Bacteroidales bacterium]